ncbi:MAG: copper resistance protein CopC [Gaiellales bacterium]
MVIARRLLLVATAAALLLLPASALGHAALISTAPEIGTIVKTAPTQVTLTFNEDINAVGAQVQVIAQDGTRYDGGAPTASGRTLSQTLKPGLPEGTSTVAWTVISADGHRISNAFQFSVGRESLGGATDPSATNAAAAALERPAGSATLTAVSRALRFAGIILLLGLLAIVALVWDPTLRRGRDDDPATAAAADGAFRPVALWFARLTPPLLALVALLTIPLEAWSDGIDLQGVLELRQGQVAVAQALLALLAWPLAIRAVRSGSTRNVVAAAVPAVLLAVTPGLSGHAGAQDPAWLSVLVDWVHVLAAGAWGGGVILLAATAPAVFRATTAETRPPLLRGVVRRFTRIALVALAALVATGAVAALILTSSLTELVDSSWGRILIAKVVVVLAAVLIAGIARRASRTFATAVQLEALLIVVAIALTGTLTGLAPQAPGAAGAATTIATSSGFELVQKVDAREAQIAINPTTVGKPSEVHIIVTNGVGQPAFDVKDASLVLAQGDATKLGADLTRVDTAHWTGTLRIPKPGPWKVVVRLRIGEFREAVLTGTLTAT